MQKNFFVHSTAVIDEGVTIGDGTSIWHFSYLMKGCSVGHNCNIGQNVFMASTVVLVNKDVAAYALVTGNPAKQTGWMSEHGNKLSFNEEGMAICKPTGETYRLKDGIVEKL